MPEPEAFLTLIHPQTDGELTRLPLQRGECLALLTSAQTIEEILSILNTTERTVSGWQIEAVPEQMLLPDIRVVRVDQQEKTAFTHSLPSLQSMDSRKRAILEILNLSDQGEVSWFSLTHEEQLRVLLAEACLQNPELLLWRLPDVLPETVGDMFCKLQKLLGFTALVGTASAQAAVSISDRVAILQWNQLLFLGDPEAQRLHPGFQHLAEAVGLDNELAATVIARGPGNRIALDIGGYTVPSYAWGRMPALGEAVRLMMDSLEIRCSSTMHKGFHVSAAVAGPNSLELPDQQILHTAEQLNQPIGSQVFVWWDPEHTGAVTERS